jgi:hypothetical protein
MTSTLALQQAVWNFFAQVPPGERIETLALATTLLVQPNDPAASKMPARSSGERQPPSAWNGGTKNSDRARSSVDRVSRFEREGRELNPLRARQAPVSKVCRSALRAPAVLSFEVSPVVCPAFVGAPLGGFPCSDQC